MSPRPHPQDRIEEARRQRGRFYDPVTGKLHVAIAGGSDTSSTTPPATPPATTPPPPAAPPPPAGATPPATTPPGPSDSEIQARVDAALRKQQEETQAFFAAEAIKAEQAKLDDQARAEAERDAARAEVEQMQAESAKREHDDRIKRALLLAKVPLESVERARFLITAPQGCTDDELTSDIEKARTELPGVFATEPATGQPGVPPVTPPGNGSAPPASGVEAGRERARREKEAQKAVDPLTRFQRVGA